MKAIQTGSLALLCALLPICAAAEELPARETADLPCIVEALRGEPLCLDTDALLEQYGWLDAASAFHPACEALEDEQTGRLCLRLTGGLDYAYFPEADVYFSGVASRSLHFVYDVERSLFVCDEDESGAALFDLAQALQGEAGSSRLSLNYTGALRSGVASGALAYCQFSVDPREGGVCTDLILRYIDGEKTEHAYTWSRTLLDYANDQSSLVMRFSDGRPSCYQLRFDSVDGDASYNICYDPYGEVYDPYRKGYSNRYFTPRADLADASGERFTYRWDAGEQIWKPLSKNAPAGITPLSPYDERFASPYASLYPGQTPPPIRKPDAASAPATPTPDDKPHPTRTPRG